LFLAAGFLLLSGMAILGEGVPSFRISGDTSPRTAGTLDRSGS
jgi:hypothetical protein